jgi:hypothetical protein
LFILQDHLVFLPKSLSEEPIIIGYSEINKVTKSKSLIMIKNAIKIFTHSQKKYFFKRIAERDALFDKLCQQIQAQMFQTKEQIMEEQNKQNQTDVSDFKNNFTNNMIEEYPAFKQEEVTVDTLV